MRIVLSSLAAVLLFVAASVQSFANDAGVDIVVKVTGLRNSDGQILISLYHTSEGFPGGTEGVLKSMKVTIDARTATGTFEDISPGQYAIAIIHDEDKDGKLSTNFIGIPKEGVGSSNNPKMRFGPPKWKDAVFAVGDEPIELEIRPQYL